MLGSLEKVSTFFIAWNLGKRECFLFRPKSSVEVAKFTLAPKIAQKWMLWCFLLYRNSFISLSGSCSSLRHVCVTPAQQGSLPGVPGIHGQQKGSLERLQLQCKFHILTVMSLGSYLGFLQIHTSLWISGDECCVSWLFHFHPRGCSLFSCRAPLKITIKMRGPHHMVVVSSWGLMKMFSLNHQQKNAVYQCLLDCVLCWYVLPCPLSGPPAKKKNKFKSLSMFSRNVGWQFHRSQTFSFTYFPCISFFF